MLLALFFTPEAGVWTVRDDVIFAILARTGSKHDYTQLPMRKHRRSVSRYGEHTTVFKCNDCSGPAPQVMSLSTKRIGTGSADAIASKFYLIAFLSSQM